MNELAVGAELGKTFEAFAQVVLHRLHVVVGPAFDLLDSGRIRFVEALEERVERAQGHLSDRLASRQLGAPGEGLEPLDLDPHPLPDEPEFAEQRAQLPHPLAVAAVDRRYRAEGARFHGIRSPDERGAPRLQAFWPVAASNAALCSALASCW